MSSQPLTSLPERRCANCGSVLLTGAPHDCARQHTPEAIAPTLAPDAPVDTAQTPVRVSVQAPEQASSDLVGQVLGERYLIERRLGQGGMGVVFAARHVVLDKQFAVKLLLTPQNEEYQRRFLQEAKLASQISHPNTVFLSDFGVLPDGRSYLVMELLRGTTLSQLLAQGRVEVHRACRIAAQTAHGLQAVHDQGIIHRGLYPGESSTEIGSK
jgi:serine/threonine-protein kinase